MTPRPWATAMPVVIFVLKNNSSMEMTSGFNCPIRSSISVPIWYSRRDSGSPAGVVMAP